MPEIASTLSPELDLAPTMPSPEGVRYALHRLGDRVARTPVLRNNDLDRAAGARLWLKAENLQHGGSFKMRGALLAIDVLAARGGAGVVAQSTGNHAIAVALAARERGLPAVLVLPVNAAPTKVDRIRAAGAEVHLVGTTLAERDAVVDEIRALRGFERIDPYENPHVVVGQGSATAELLDQVEAMGGKLDAVVVPVGGGSAVAGACLAAQDRDVSVYGAEPAAVPALTAALATGRPVTVTTRPTIADGLRPDRIGELPFTLARYAVTDVLTVDEQHIGAAMVLALTHARQLVEPAAATALAAALTVAKRGRCKDIGVLLSGGNVEPALVAALLGEHAPA